MGRVRSAFVLAVQSVLARRCFFFFRRHAQIYRLRFNLGANDHDLVAEAAPDAPVGPVGRPFALAWRNYIKSVFKKGHMYKLSCSDQLVLYVAENKTLAGKEDRNYAGEAQGRKLAWVFFERMPGGEGLVRRVQRDTVGVQQVLMTIAEVLLSLGAPGIPADPARPAAETELLLEALYEDIHIARFACSVEPEGLDEVHVYNLGDETHAELAYAHEAPVEQRTKMVLARCLQHNGRFLAGETLQSVWSLTHAALQARAAPLFPAPVVGPALDAPPGPGVGPAPDAPPGPAADRARGRGRGRGVAVPAPAVGRGRGRGRGKGRGRA